MKKLIFWISCFAIFFAAPAQSVNPSKDWKLGIALWTFHTVSFSQALDMVDSSGLKYIEPNNFTKLFLS